MEISERLQAERWCPMWRLITLASLLVTLAIGTAANASPICRICIESVQAERSDAGTTLRFIARPADGVALPETGTAVVMQVDGNRAKCINVVLRRIEQSGGLATYSGVFTAFQGAYKTFTGRVDIGGEIHEFTLPLDGTPGSAQFVAAPQVATAQPQVATAQPVPAAEPDAVQAASHVPEPVALTQEPVLLGLALLVVVVVSTYVDRKRALRASAAE